MHWLQWLESTALGVAVRQSSWLYPAAEVVHILGLALLIGCAVMWDLRLLGLSRRLPVSDMARHLLPGARAGFAVAVASGLLLFLADAVAIAANPAFRIKLLLIAAAVLNTGVFHARSFHSVAEWDVGTLPPRSARAAAVLSLCLWSLAAVAGRLIAYV